MVSEREIEAAMSGWHRALIDAPDESVYERRRRCIHAALSAAARVREETNAKGGKSSLSDITASLGYRVPDPAPQPSGTVKALEWKKPKELRFRAACTHFGYEYFIDQTPNGWLLQTYLFGDEYWETLGTYPDLDDAKYAAQADYERRILSALTAGKPAQECATEGCDKPATDYFERGGVGSHYCHGCYVKAQAVTTPPMAGGGDA